METTVEQLIKERSTFASLSGEELEMVKELCETEEEFQTMKQFFHELENVSASRKTIINPEVKNSLDNIFSAKHPGLRANWTAPETAAAPLAPVIPLHQRTWVRIAAVAILILGTAPFWNMLRNELPANENKPTARLEKPAPKPTIESPVAGEKATAPSFNRSGNTESAQYVAEADAEDNAPAPMQEEPMIASGNSTTLTAGGVTAHTYMWSAAPAKETDKGSKDQSGSQYFTKSDASTQPASLGATMLTTPAATTFGYSANYTVKEPATLSSIGLNADLYPEAAGITSMNGCAVNALSLADQPDVLDLLVPAF
jgi:hypothetical protein